eukprot:tig00021464_g21737.t1
MVSTTNKVVRSTLGFANVIYLIGAIILIAVGSWAKSKGSGNLVGAVGNTNLPVGMIVMGVFLFCLGVLGIVSAKTTNKILLAIYAFFTFLIMIIVFAITIALFVVAASFSDPTNLYNEYKAVVKSQPIVACDFFRGLSCSGFLNPCNASGVVIPEECPASCTNYWPASQGCYSLIKGEVSSSFNALAAISLIIDLVLLVGFLFSLFTCCTPAEKDYLASRDGL